MERRGGCCIARYGYDTSNVDRIMLRFRPIAPKPTSGESPSPPASFSDPVAKNGRGKRRYTTKNGGCTNKKRKAPPSPDEKISETTAGSSISWSGSGGDSDAVVTLPLLPATPANNMQVRNNIPDLGFPRNSDGSTPAPVWLCFDGRRRKTVETRVTVECVTGACTDEDRRVDLERDTCPGFVSDGEGRVTWTNEAYGRMVGQGEEVEAVVWVAMKERVRVMLMYMRAFSCRVKVQYTCGKDTRSVTVPCDAWRIDGGGFAWRLDVKAALTLSLNINPN